MKITPSSTARVPDKGADTGKRAISVTAILLTALAASLFFSLLTYKLTKEYFPAGIKKWLWEIAEQDYGFRVYARRDDDSLGRALLQVPERLTREVDIPKIFIDIGFTQLQKLYAKRAQALKTRVLVQGPDDWVPAAIRSGNETVKVKLRLKGDWTDHLEGDKWSFRIHTKGNGQLLGLRRFSIQQPATRGYQGEVLFHETLRQFGVLTPGYAFIDVVINGDSIGIMALEEHFSKELLERNGRKDGVIIRYDESLTWEGRVRAKDLRGEVFETYLNAPIDAFGSSRIRKSERLSREYAIATGLLRGFTNGSMQASEVFDAEQLGSYLGVAEFWGAEHEIVWHNQRFYLNPLTLKLEPIAFDANLQHRMAVGDTASNLPLVKKMLEDPEVSAVFKRTLDSLVEQVDNGTLIAHLQQAEKVHLDRLQKEYVFLDPFNYDELRQRARQIPDRNRPSIKPEIYPVFIHANLLQDDNRSYLELSNALPHEVEVQSILWVDKTGNSLPFQPETPLDYPLVLTGTDLHTLPLPQRFEYRPLDSKIRHRLEVTAAIKGYDKPRTTDARQYFPPLHENPMPGSDIASLLAGHPFLSLREDSSIRVQAGSWQVQGNIVIPAGHEFVVPAGTTLQFEKGGSLVVYGTTLLQGTADQPIVLEGIPDTGSTGSWQGAAIYYAPARSQWSHVTVRNTTGMDWPSWQLTGGVTFYKSDVDMQHGTFQGNTGEDALNIVHSDFNLHDIRIIDTVSDGFDGDFTTGTISGGVFRNIGTAGGGDAIDVSGSSVTIDGTQFTKISDKAISVGEGSNLTASRISAEDCGVGAASKDNSRLTINESTIRNARNAGLMAYTKKQEFGPASLVASDLVILDSATPARVQQGSYLELNGEQVTSEAMDIKGLYNTIMKPGLRK